MSSERSSETESLFWWTASGMTDLTLFSTLVWLQPEAELAAGEGTGNSVSYSVVCYWTVQEKSAAAWSSCCQHSPLWGPHCQDGRCHGELDCFKQRLSSYLNYILWGTENLPGLLRNNFLWQLQISMISRCTCILLFLPYVPLAPNRLGRRC